MRGTFLAPLSILLSILALPAKAQNSEMGPSAERNPSWAVKVLDVPEVSKLFLVEPNFYRSPQPTEDGFNALVIRKGLRTAVNLRASHSDDALTRGLGLRLFDFKMHAWHIEREDVVGPRGPHAGVERRNGQDSVREDKGRFFASGVSDGDEFHGSLWLRAYPLIKIATVFIDG